MESPKKEDETLQMFFDGELSPEEEAAVRQILEASPEGQAQLHQWEQLREAMRSTSSEWSAKIDSDALFARIEREIETPAEQPALRVIPGGGERRVWGAMAVGLAAAAAVFLAVIAWPAEQTPPDVANAVMPAARGSEVLEIDFGSNTGTTFVVEGGAGESLAVVWISDEEVGIP